MASSARRSSFAAIVLALAASALGAPAGAQAASASCSKVASASGSDSARGDAARPFRSAQKLANSLAPGETGCLRSGVYTENVEFTRAGTSSSRITFQSYPSERARIVGEVAVRAGADNVTVANLDLNGRTAEHWPSPAVSADSVAFEGNDVSNDNTAVCFLIGTSSGRPQNTSIRSNRIHNCGKLPATNLHEGIYVSNADGTTITDNTIYDNADMGIQLYPDAQRSVIRGNVIDGNGEGIIFSGDHGKVAHDNLVENNVITNSRIRENVESYYDPGTPVGRRNRVRNNCISGGASDDGDGGIGRPVGFTLSGNLTIDPHYANRGAKDFRVSQDSPCHTMLSGGTPPPPRVVITIPRTPVTAGAPTLVRGLVKRRRTAASAALVSGRRVALQRRTPSGWLTVARGRVSRKASFRLRIRVGTPRGRAVVRLRAVVRQVGRSKTRSLHVRRAR